ncbi:MAG TPA: prepilin-type N-terminal cleavage/methylation domain-containing protein [Bryobacteraceae bacterium]|nr:prepilin-type N-terminal cleavage/methylation domain-containing protein [Bryobacteraceae bacterium]
MKKTRRQFGFSLIELLIVIAIILIILAVAMPKLSRARMYSQEMAALQAIKTIHTGQTQYYSQFSKYAATLAELGPPTSGTVGPAASDLIPEDLALGEKQGYKFTLTATPGGYIVNANPIAFGTSGSRTFYSDQSMVIRQNFGQEPATAASPIFK